MDGVTEYTANEPEHSGNSGENKQHVGWIKPVRWKTDTSPDTKA